MAVPETAEPQPTKASKAAARSSPLSRTVPSSGIWIGSRNSLTKGGPGLLTTQCHLNGLRSQLTTQAQQQCGPWYLGQSSFRWACPHRPRPRSRKGKVSQPEMAPAVKQEMKKVIVICVCARTQMCAESSHYTCVCC